MSCKSNEYIAPLGRARQGRLVFLSGASGITLLADPVIPDLARGHFNRPVPSIENREGVLFVHSHHSPQIDRQISSSGKRGEIRLNASIPWEIECRGSLTGLHADLRGLQLRSLDVLGGAIGVTLRLSRPPGSGFIYISGDARQITVLRPPDSGVVLMVHGGISGLSLDGQRIEGIEGEARVESADSSGTKSRYEIGIAGSAHDVSIDYENRN